MPSEVTEMHYSLVSRYQAIVYYRTHSADSNKRKPIITLTFKIFFSTAFFLLQIVVTIEVTGATGGEFFAAEEAVGGELTRKLGGESVSGWIPVKGCAPAVDGKAGVCCCCCCCPPPPPRLRKDSR